MKKEKDMPLDRAFLAAQALDRSADYSAGFRKGQEAERLWVLKEVEQVMEQGNWKAFLEFREKLQKERK